MTEWQPIETAPNVGRFLVLGGHSRGERWFSGDHLIPEAVCLVERDEDGGFVVKPGWYETIVVIEPTHWMPLPEPPKESA